MPFLRERAAASTRSLRTVAALAALSIALPLACELAPTDELLAGKSCTPLGECAEGYACDTSTNVCVPEGSASGGSGAGGDGAGGGGATCGEDPAPSGEDCPPACKTCSDDGACHIECGNNACSGRSIECPDGFDCLVLCNGNKACTDATVACSAEQRCEVSCEKGCKGLVIACGAGACELTCGGGSACTDVELQCGPDRCTATCDGSVDEPDVMCGGSCDCSEC